MNSWYRAALLVFVVAFLTAWRPLPAPMFVGGGGGGPAGTVYEFGDQNYSLTAYGTNIETVFPGTPAVPTGAAELTGLTTYTGDAADTCGEIQALLDGGNARIQPEVGPDYSACDLTFDVSNNWLEMDNSQTFGVISLDEIEAGPGGTLDSVKITGGAFAGFAFPFNSGAETDLTNLWIENTVITSACGNQWDGGFMPVTGLTLIGNDVNADCYAWIGPVFNAVVANNNFRGQLSITGNAAFIMSGDRQIHADNCYHNASVQRIVRWRGGSEDVLMQNTVMTGAASAVSAGPWLETESGGTPDASVDNFLFDGNALWDSRASDLAFGTLTEGHNDGGSWDITNVTYSNNEVHTALTSGGSFRIDDDTGGPDTCEVIPTGDCYTIGAGNTFTAEGGGFAFPACTFGADH